MQDKGFPNGANDARRGIDFIGVSCGFVCHDGTGRFLLHKRSQHCRDEQGTWDNGAGSHEFGTTIEETIRRELKEEHGADALDMQFVGVQDYHRQLADGTPTHWICITYAVRVDPAQVTNNEPYKIDEIGWFTLDNLPTPLHSTLMSRLDAAHAAGVI